MNEMLQTERPPMRAARTVTAADLMTPNPASIRDVATVWDAVYFLTTKGFSAAPVINAAGRPVGVISRSDLIIHNREAAEHLRPPRADRPVVAVEPGGVAYDPTPVCDVMTPFVLLVAPDTPVTSVARQMADFKVHRLFVVDDEGVLVGVVSALDVMRHFGHPEGAAGPLLPNLLDEE